jgi:hypothetical protein
VEIDEVRIGEQDLDPPERVVGAGTLPEHVTEVLPGRPGPVDRGRIHRLAVAIEDFELLLREVSRIAPHRRQDVLGENRRRNRPRRIEDHVVDRRLEDRRLPVRLPDLDATPPEDVAVAVVRSLEPRDVHEDEVVGVDFVQRPPRPLEVDADLADSGFDRDVQLRERPRSDASVRGQAVPRLEGAHGVGERLVEGPIVQGLAGEIARGREAAPQDRDPGVGDSGLQARARRNRGPASARRDPAILGERGAGVVVPRVFRARGRDRVVEKPARERLRHERDGVAFDDRAKLEVPLRIE